MHGAMQPEPAPFRHPLPPPKEAASAAGVSPEDGWRRVGSAPACRSQERGRRAQQAERAAADEGRAPSSQTCIKDCSSVYPP